MAVEVGAKADDATVVVGASAPCHEEALNGPSHRVESSRPSRRVELNARSRRVELNVPTLAGATAAGPDRTSPFHVALSRTVPMATGRTTTGTDLTATD